MGACVLTGPQGRTRRSRPPPAALTAAGSCSAGARACWIRGQTPGWASLGLRSFQRTFRRQHWRRCWASNSPGSLWQFS